MRQILILLFTIVALGVNTSVEAKKTKVPKMYIFGMAASFNDTIVHFTNVQELDSAWIDNKNNFLLTRELYSYQLRDFLANSKQMPRRTCIVVANKNRKKLEKKFLKMKKIYTKSKDNKQHYDVRFLDDKEFRFKTVKLQDYENVDAQQ